MYVGSIDAATPMKERKPTPRKTLSTDQREKVLRRYQASEAVEEIAADHGVLPAAVYSIASRAGVHRQRNLTHEDKRVILSLHHQGRLSQREIGRRLHTSPTSVRRVVGQGDPGEEI